MATNAVEPGQINVLLLPVEYIFGGGGSFPVFVSALKFQMCSVPIL